ncbi:LINE-1 retrotransposable element ORF2 protein [Symbiodinium microadriaticum]|uniref:LINE-1 retrotransposable element ORF2 protein n=1 Tax=Symbiodinium microadriaticum TaxID=2951 RepID=A0A1Q9C1W9_SYMMI|nr:LINE-1 retrotransposable element ORF2 protein [Symbiodinium microadriaticum]CAE7864490.1 Pol [Symbiodinium microadriaticum]
MLDGSEPDFLELLAAEEEQMEDTPHCEIRAGPAVPDNTGPKGPPPPRPIHEVRDPPRGEDGNQAGSSRDDSRDARPLPDAGAKVAVGEDRGPPSSSSTSSSEPEGSVSGNSLTWSETSLVLEGPSLEQAGSQLVSTYRSQATGKRSSALPAYAYMENIYAGDLPDATNEYPGPHAHMARALPGELTSDPQEGDLLCPRQGSIVDPRQCRLRAHSSLNQGTWYKGVCGPNRLLGAGRCSGILFLLRRQKFKDPRFLEILPGVYQHVWRSGLTSARNLELRRGLLDQLDKTLLTIPRRHHLALCGDFNSAIRPEHPIVGSSVPLAETPPDSDLTALLHKHSLCVLNTWHARPSTTYFSPTGATQIDYVIARQQAACLQAKRAFPDHAFPVGGHRLTGHYPVRAQLPMQSYHRTSVQDPAAGAQLDLPALQQAIQQASPAALDMQARIASRLQQVDTCQLTSAHRHINRILLEEAQHAFPPQPKPDVRVSAHPAFRVTARSVWHLYRQFKRPNVCALHTIFSKWRLAAQFARASQILRRQSAALKRQYFESQVELAEQAASRGDQRGLFLIVRRLSPKTRKLASRLRGADGCLLSAQEELQHITAYGNQTFAAKLDNYPIAPLAQDIHISDQDLEVELSKLGLAKAVPKHIAPAAIWKLCSADLSHVLGKALRAHLLCGRDGHLDEDWKNCYIVWIPKPGKPAGDVSVLRPIGLSSPASKALAGSIRHHLLRHLEPLMQMLPQFAYARNRGTADALVRAHAHFDQVATLLRNTQCTRFQQQAGRKHRLCIGGLCLSLDLSKAFDGVTRAHIYASMSARGVPPEVITLVQQLHNGAQYIYQTGSHRSSTTTTNGIKQGCVIAPYLWNYFSLTFLLLLQQQRSVEWIQQVLSLFADDVWGSWEIHSADDLAGAIQDVSLVLEILETLEMTINYSKTVILLRLSGKDASQLKRQHTFMKAGQLHLRLTVHGRDCGLPIKDQHEYLGTVVTYRHRHQRNMQHRLKASGARYQGLRKLLNGSHHLTEAYRLRLWQACVCTSALYAHHVVGLTSGSLRSLTVTLTRHLRAILRIPAHLTHISTGDVWQRANLPMPGWTVQQTQSRYLGQLEHRAVHSSDITTSDAALAHVRRQAQALEVVLLDAAASLAKTPPRELTVSCPYCSEVFPTENAMRVHCMPACQLCNRQFWRMYNSPDFAFNEEAEIFANCWHSPPEFLMTSDGRSQKRHRPDQAQPWPGRSPPLQPHPGNPYRGHPFGPRHHQQDPVRLLTKVVLQQEQVISRLRHEKGFVLFMRQGEDGTLGSLMRVAKEWNAKKAQDHQALHSPLRTVLLSSMVKELLNRAQQAVATEENRAKMIAAEWLTASSEWNYRTWNRSEKRLIVDGSKTPLQHAEIVRILNYLLEHLTGEAIQRFGSTVTLPKLEQQGAQMATFALEVSLRGQTAAELYQHFERLCGNSIMSLIGVSMKKDTMPQTPAAKQLANLYYHK